MAFLVGHTSSNNIESLIEQIDQEEIKFILVFYPVEIKGEEIGRKLKNRYPQAVIFGCTMIGGWCPAKPVDKEIIAASLGADMIERVFPFMETGIKKDIDGCSQRLVNALQKQFQGEQIKADEYLGLVLLDGLGLGEHVMKELTSADYISFPFVGGAAADELTFTETRILLNEIESADAAGVVILKMKVPFFYGHFVHYIPTDKQMLVTQAEPDQRVIWEFDGQPAAQVYANLLGLKDVKELTHIHFSNNPFGVVIDKDLYARSPNAVVDGKGLRFYCWVEAGTYLTLLEKGDIIGNTKKGIKKVGFYLDNIQGAFLFNCVLRYLELKEDNKMDEFNSLFKDFPFIGFNTYGEELFTHHNQTLTAVFFGGEESF